MSFDALLHGKLRGAVAVKQSANGNDYATFKLTTTDKKGASLLASVITFSESAIDTVRRLGDGDSVAVSGEAAISTWTGSDGAARYGLDVTAHQAMTAYHAGRKRADKPTAVRPNMGTPPAQRTQQTGGEPHDDFGDADLNF